jgi:hypothetical protein
MSTETELMLMRGELERLTSRIKGLEQRLNVLEDSSTQRTLQNKKPSDVFQSW